MKLEAAVLRDLDVANHREWLLADGLGGYASSTVIGLHTRRYHGLLVAALRPPVERMVLLSKLEEALVLGERRHDLSTNAYATGSWTNASAGASIPAGSSARSPSSWTRCPP